MSRETTMICDACSRVIDGIDSALAETLRGPSGDDAVDLCDWCVDGVREFLKKKRTKAGEPSSVVDGCSKALDSIYGVTTVFKPGKPIKPTVMKEPDIEQVSRIMDLERAAADLRMCNQRLDCEVARLEGVIEGMEKGKNGKPDVQQRQLERRNTAVADHLPAGSIVVSVAHPCKSATVYLIFGEAPAPDIVVVYNDENLTAAAVADLIRNRAGASSAVSVMPPSKDVDRDFDPGGPRLKWSEP